jgi:hypothetical protein
MAYEFKTAVQKQVYDKVVGFMREMFGEMLHFRDDGPVIGVAAGSAYVQVMVFPRNEDDATVLARAWVVTGVEGRPDLYKFLLEANYKVLCGGFAIDEVGDICFDHTIMGSHLDKNELKTSVMVVRAIADEYDDIIVSRWGGQRAVDRK